MSSRTGTKRGRVGTPAYTTTDVPVRLRCLACGGQATIEVATRGRLAAMTNDERDILDEFTRTHDATQIVP